MDESLSLARPIVGPRGITHRQGQWDDNSREIAGVRGQRDH